MYKDFDAGFEGGFDNTADNSSLTLQADGAAVDLPDASYIRDADMTRDGMDLVLDGPQGEIIVEGYFAADPAPMLTADDGSALTPELVNSFVQSTPEYAQNMSMTDESPVGAVQEMSGDATVTRTDGSVENLENGMPIFQGDVIETGSDGAVNISFIDDSSFAVSEDARLAIDEYVFDPSTEAGTQNFSVLKGVFVFTSGLIGRDDPDDVEIDTPMGSIGIRGTIIAGDVNSGEITVVEGAIVLRDFDGNEVTLAAQFDTATFKPGEGIEHNGQKAANDVADKFVSVAKVAPGLFSSINDAAAEALDTQGENEAPDVEEMLDDAGDDADVDGSVDQNADGEVDGSVDDSAAASDGEGDVAEDTVEDTAEGDGEVVTAQTTTNNSLGTDGLGGDDGGLGGQAQTQSPAQTANRSAPTSGSNTSSTQSGSDAAAAGSHNVGDGTTDPGVLNGGDNGPTPQAPHITFNAPHDPSGANFFAVVNDHFTGTNDWSYHFDKSFFDPDGDGTDLVFDITVDADANNYLTDQDGDITGMSGYSSVGDGWAFDHENGLLRLDVENFGTDGQFHITITANDAQGLSTSETFTFEAFHTSTTIAGTSTAVTGQTLIIDNTGPVFNFNGGAANNTAFITDNAGTLHVTLNSGADGNTIYFNQNSNDRSIQVQDNAINNTIFGGYGDDTFILNNEGNNFIYGMDGADTFKVSDTTLIDMQTNGGLINGGHNDVNEFDILILEGNTATATPFDFNGVSNMIKNIEKIESAGIYQSDITLTYDDVIQMTDGNNELRIAIDDNDSLTFDTQGHNMEYVETDGGYDVYSDGNVTLLVTDGLTGGVVDGLPAA